MMTIVQLWASAIDSRIQHAATRYGPFASTHEAMGVALEEWDELREAIRGNNSAQIQHECIDLAAVLIRLANDLQINEVTQARSVK